MLTLPQVLTQAQALEVLSQFQVVLAQVRRNADEVVVVDGSALERFDSSVLALLLACQRLASVAKLKIVLRGMPLKVLELARLYGVEAVLPGLVPAAP